jgi:hypothetical protein
MENLSDFDESSGLKVAEYIARGINPKGEIVP